MAIEKYNSILAQSSVLYICSAQPSVLWCTYVAKDQTFAHLVDWDYNSFGSIYILSLISW